MRVAIIEPSGKLATFQYAHNLANALAELGHDVILATGINFETKSYPRCYRVLEVFDRFVPRPIRLFRFIQYLRRFPPDIVHIQGHSHPTSYLIIRALIRAVASTKFVYTAQDVIPKFTKPHHRTALRRLYAVVDHILVNAMQNKKMLLKWFPQVSGNKVTVAPLADLTHFVTAAEGARPTFVPEDRRIILFFGNIERRKGLLVLLRAMQRVLDRVPQAHLVAAGKAFDDLKVYRDEISRLRLDDAVTLHGSYVALPDVPATFKCAEVVVLPYLEGWNSGVIATAYAHERPVIASDIGGFHEVVDDGVTGLLVPPHDPARLADAIVAVLTQGDLRARIAKGLCMRAQRSSWPSIAREVEQVYRSVLSTTERAQASA